MRQSGSKKQRKSTHSLRKSGPPAIHADPERVSKYVKPYNYRDLVEWILSPNPRIRPITWVGVRNKEAIHTIVTVFVPQLPSDLFIDNPADPRPQSVSCSQVLPAIDENFQQVFPIQAPRSQARPTDAALAEFSKIKATSKSKREQRENSGGNGEQETFSFEQSLLSDHMLGFFEYPKTKDAGFVSLDQLSNHPSRVLAVDCEMCETINGSELTRISVVDMDECVVHETLVKPDAEITDYRTRYSGITAELLEGVTTTLEDLQGWFKANVSSDDILLGHSLDCDLRALRIAHGKIIDTAIAFADGRGLPSRPSLRWLASKYLDLQIQTKDSGHDPTEDARTCVRLMKLKQQYGNSYGGHDPSERRLTKLLVEEGIRCAIVDYGVPYWDDGNAQTVISVTTDTEAVERGIKCVESGHRFVFIGLRELEGVMKRQGEVSSQVLANLNDNVSLLMKSLPPGTAVTIWSGAGDPRQQIELEQSFQGLRNELKAKGDGAESLADALSEEDRNRLNEARLIAQIGVLMPTVVTNPDDESSSANPMKAKRSHDNLNPEGEPMAKRNSS